MKGEPFALIGVNILSHEPQALKAVMRKEKLNWRTFDGSNAILNDWNYPATPMYYLIDPTGTIRQKWSGYPGEDRIDFSVMRLVEELK